MEIRTSKVTKLFKKDGVDSYGKYSFTLEFDNGDKGFYNSKDGDQKYFIAGNVSDYTIEAKTSKAGSTYYVINHPEEKTVQAFAGKSGGYKADPKVSMIGFTASYVKDLIVADRVKLDDFEKYFNKIYNIMSSKL